MGFWGVQSFNLYVWPILKGAIRFCVDYRALTWNHMVANAYTCRWLMGSNGEVEICLWMENGCPCISSNLGLGREIPARSERFQVLFQSIGSSDLVDGCMGNWSRPMRTKIGSVWLSAAATERLFLEIPGSLISSKISVLICSAQ
jgi:hypothetical protein